MTTRTAPQGRAKSDGISVLSKTAAFCAESPLWDPRTCSLCWTDIDGRRLHRLNWRDGTEFRRDMPGRVGCIALHASGGYLAAMEDRIVILDLEFRLRDTLCVVGFDQATQRFNDGKVDRSGAHFWVGSIYLPRDHKAAGIWRFSYDGSITKVVEGITTANGIAWSPDGAIMYFADSWHRTIWAADYDTERGEISRQRPFFRLAPGMGRPDGATVDSAGFYWCAAFGASKLLRISPDGRLDRTVEMPMTRPTMGSFGGNAGDVLFVSSYGGPRHTKDRANDPLAGQVISLNVAVSGPLEAQMRIGAADTAGSELD